ncbi:MAG: hypothetical protein KC502_22330 [Myxococcales bacterium]|nr:hypothetical protein [Myxococcales bacterium]
MRRRLYPCRAVATVAMGVTLAVIGACGTSNPPSNTGTSDIAAGDSQETTDGSGTVGHDVATTADAPTHGTDSGSAQHADGSAVSDAEDVASSASDTAAGGTPCSLVATSGHPQAKEKLATAEHVLDNTGAAVDVASIKGKWTVLWFYPAAQTAG